MFTQGAEVETAVHGAWRRATVEESVVVGYPDRILVRDRSGDRLLVRKVDTRKVAGSPELPNSSQTGQSDSSPDLSNLPVDRTARDEEEVQEKAIPALIAAGFRILQTSVRAFLVDCPKCKHRFRPRRPTGQTPGVPDLLVQRLTGWGDLWRAVEVKGPKTELSDAQKILRASGSIRVARSAEAAVMLAESPWPDPERSDMGKQNRHASVAEQQMGGLFDDETDMATRELTGKEARERMVLMYAEDLLLNPPGKLPSVAADDPRREENALKFAQADVARMFRAMERDGFDIVLRGQRKGGK